MFVLAVNMPQHGMIRHEFEADYGVFYDVDDDWLIDILRRHIPQIDWGWLTYHKAIDHSGINLINPDSGRVIGQIYPRGSRSQVAAGELPDGVASMATWRKKFEQRGGSDDCTAS